MRRRQWRQPLQSSPRHSDARTRASSIQGSASASTVVVAIGKHGQHSAGGTASAGQGGRHRSADGTCAAAVGRTGAVCTAPPDGSARGSAARRAGRHLPRRAVLGYCDRRVPCASAAPVRATSVNVYGKASADVIATVREALGLEPLAVAETEAEVVSAEEAAAPAEAGEVSLADTEPQAYVDSPLAIAQRLAFPEAFATAVTARPGEKTFTVKVSSKYRMTPDSYDRNIIHIEFDARGTGLTYEIGDALGVFGYNDASQVSDFCAQYGLDQSQYVTALKDGQSQTRSVHSWLTHALDLFGRPSKKFYAALADFATDTAQADKLRWLTTSEGAVEFKDRVADTVTYADLLLEFGSARPSILHLVDMIPAIKPRHYSIASSAKMHPGYVHLCVVIVEWKNSRGQLRTGQCTRFLDALEIGTPVVVSVKPSVMKLPPLDSQPVIMAGLGTGMAPFRAFIEERAVRAAQGHAVGPMTLYMGSRHRANGVPVRRGARGLPRRRPTDQSASGVLA
ncbi:riboflavin synthase domain-like protein [Linderina pennispora]|uniref:assimilatory sulfite reductase (NADPH) n=1 Tax=Linderina pennispora TaxID=61395 RepID=A0A1Y1WFE0_9FUNG|nr:riboflavin synthase domain-like protein [Linderina pennispora]ORX72207.1 riboflavin synthase domain-like protein [Linderina pennispora]